MEKKLEMMCCTHSKKCMGMHSQGGSESEEKSSLVKGTTFWTIQKEVTKHALGETLNMKSDLANAIWWAS